MTAEELAGARIKFASLVAAGEGADVIEVDDVEIDAVDADMPLDELEEGEELITEIPVHGVATIEGKATGDGRGFKPGALSIGTMPQPLGFEYVSTHGGDTSNVAIVGRIDEYWREDVDGHTEIRWRGAIMPAKEYAARAIESIIDGSYTGLSVVVDSVSLDVEEERESVRRMLLRDRDAFVAVQDDEEAEPPAPMTDDEIESLVDEYVGDGSQPVTWFREARVRRFDMVPTGAFQEGYIALGSEFWDELTPEQIVAAADALDECGCGMSIRASADGGFNVFDLSLLTEEEFDHYESLSSEEQDAYAAEKGIITASAFAPGTKDGPGWVTHPQATSRIRRYWVEGEGAAKIGWGTPGSFNRCRAQLIKYVQNPDWLAGLCANMYHEATGRWPGVQRGDKGLTASAQPGKLFSLVASAEPIDASYFKRRELENPRVGVVVDGDAVYGYIAQFSVCHIGIQDRCTLAPQSVTNYAHFRTGTVMTTEGPVYVGQITMDTGHAGDSLSPRATVSHYDNTGTVAADVATGEDQFGIWFAGRIRPGLSDESRFALAASGRVSGDWRLIGGNYELVAALVVNVAGFPIPDVSLVASADLGATAILAAGIIRPEDENMPLDGEATAPESSLTADDIAGIAVAAAEQVFNLQRRQEITDRVAPARAKVAALALDAARAELSSLKEV